MLKLYLLSDNATGEHQALVAATNASPLLSIPDLQFLYLGSLNYTGALPDRIKTFFEGGNSVIDLTPPVPSNLILPQEDADFTQQGIWTGSNWSVANGVATKGVTSGVANFDHDVSIPAGPIWIEYDISDSNSVIGLRVRVRGGAGGDSGNLINTTNVQRYARLFTPSDVNTDIRFQGVSTWAGSVDNAAVYDMSSIQALPADIYILAGQSNMSGTDALDFSISRDGGNIHPYITSWNIENDTNYGFLAGAESAAYDPLQHNTNNQRGVGPGMAFAKRLLELGTNGRRILLVCTATPNTGLTTADTHWNSPLGSNYTAMVTAAQNALSAMPSGSAIRGVLWSQGENDNGANVGTIYPPAFSNFVSNLRTALSISDLPFVILGTNPERDQEVSGGLLGTTQASLDEDSGDVNAISGVHYVATPSGYQIVAGSSHMTAAGHNIRGIAGAEIMQTNKAGIPGQSSNSSFSSAFGPSFGE